MKCENSPQKGGQLPLPLLTSPKWKTLVTYIYTYTSTFDDADIQDSKILKFEFLKNENSFWSEIKQFFLVLKVPFFGLKKQKQNYIGHNL